MRFYGLIRGVIKTLCWAVKPVLSIRGTEGFNLHHSKSTLGNASKSRESLVECVRLGDEVLGKTFQIFVTKST